jgi:hypothetical protein
MDTGGGVAGVDGGSAADPAGFGTFTVVRGHDGETTYPLSVLEPNMCESPFVRRVRPGGEGMGFASPKCCN